ISIISLLFSLLSAFLILSNQLIVALLMLAISLFLDALDGTVARKYNLTSALGQKLEIIFDRTSEFVIFAALSLSGVVGIDLVLFTMLAILIMTALSFKTKYDFGAKRIMVFFGPLIGFSNIFYFIIAVQVLAITASLIKLIKRYGHFE
ncbi:hypothetical protein COX24_01230, partial [bacterium (Candidatus Gribaldobacteria) CG23_combo_of_CG06-09_8_20_14_all_37_87_8]